ncbi:MAG: hypothetical protein KIS62_03125 [Ramlibacter sp.]|nr:hypothetical protein [Ramlibacter sp.]
MPYENLEFKEFDDASLKATREVWLAESSDGLAFYSEMERLLDWADTHRQPAESDSAAFGIFRQGKRQAMGICEIVIQRKTIRSKWIKMLRLHLRPSVDADLQAGNTTNAMNVFASSIAGTLGLQMTHKATTLKVYGRTNDQLAFLRLLVEHMEKNLPEAAKNAAKVTIDGRFLSIVV